MKQFNQFFLNVFSGSAYQIPRCDDHRSSDICKSGTNFSLGAFGCDGGEKSLAECDIVVRNSLADPSKCCRFLDEICIILQSFGGNVSQTTPDCERSNVSWVGCGPKIAEPKKELDPSGFSSPV